MEPTANWVRRVIDPGGEIRHPRHRLQDHGVMCGRSYISTPGEGTVIGYQNCGNNSITHLLKGPNNCVSSVFLIFGDDCAIAHRSCHRDRTVEVVGMGGAEAWNWLAGLRPRGRILGMGVGDATDFRESMIEDKMRGQVGGGPQSAFDDLAIEIGDHQMLWFHLRVRNPAGLDHYQFLVPGDATGIAEGIKYQSLSHQFQIRFQHLFPQSRQKHSEAVPRRILNLAEVIVYHTKKKMCVRYRAFQL